MDFASRSKRWNSLAAQMNQKMNMVTTMHPLATDATMATVADLNTLYRMAIAKYIILIKNKVTISPVME
ncbi:hypothetical protein CY34DRAFT_801322 [Suillus luteus UH-Slu-Lm8-n1]|uniref:Uncharacterized protein n=1 Tax=Suillus luteus UH-Slu-Lm8-n1 TaxID=930992 RepID=A0A0D0BI15_9AGAM|nr:hypothetical protein CY34DRAFT_801322 [Suillus luteus UH-Slu-Lm8-n1]